jgi:uncharacterized membrane protein (DUF4010 family)
MEGATLEAWQAVGVALAIGLLMGAERERSAGEHPVAGVRTFALVSLAGCLAAMLPPVLGAMVGAAALGLGLLAYLAARGSDRGITSETAMVVALALGALAARQPGLAAGVAVAVTALLATKQQLHLFVRRTVSEIEMDDALRFGAAAFIVLPLLPSGPASWLGGIDMRRLWLLVVLVTGVGWVAYVAVRVLGAERGLMVAALAGGFVSGAATTGAMAARARDPAVHRAAVAATCLVSVATLAQLVAVVGLAAPSMVGRFVPAAVGGSAVLLVEAWLVTRFRARGPTTPVEVSRQEAVVTVPGAGGRPFAIRPALVLAVVITVVSGLSGRAQDRLGSGGVAMVGGIGGLADAHAAALSVTSLAVAGTVPVGAAVAATGVGLATNTLVKIGLAAAAGGVRVAGEIALLLLPAAVVVALLLVAAA